MKWKTFLVLLTAGVLVVIVSWGLYRWVAFGEFDGSTLFYGSLATAFLFNALTWGEYYGKTEPDELDLHITAQSAKIGYFVLMIASGLILFATEKTASLREVSNVPLLAVVCLTFVVLFQATPIDFR